MAKSKLSDAEQVSEYMAALKHPMKDEMEALRTIIKGTDKRLAERIKWNAPSYYYSVDLVTFGPPMRKKDEVMLVFHHPNIVKIKSDLLEGDYKDRRLAVFHSMKEIKENKAELERILSELISSLENKK